MIANILDKIVAAKKEEIVAARRREPEADCRRRAENRDGQRPFAAGLKDCHDGKKTGIIAEIKRASPSAGVIRESLDAAACARQYEAGGAAALSVLTDHPFFQGTLADLVSARRAVSLPVLRKDFLITFYQVYESAAAGADAVLLIVRLLENGQLRDMLALCRQLGLDALVEVHNENDLKRASSAGADIIGINNRDLSTFATDTAVAIGLVSRMNRGQVPVAASGIKSAGDVRRGRQAGIYNFLIGESLVRAGDTAAFLRQLAEILE